MTGRRLGALLVVFGVVVAGACGSDDEPPSPPGGTTAGTSGSASSSAGQAPGGSSTSGGDGALAGSGGTSSVSGSGSSLGGADQAGAGPGVLGGAAGETSGGQGGEAGASGNGGDGSVPALFADDFDGEHLEAQGLYTENYVEFAQWDVTSGSVDVTMLPNGDIDSPGAYGAGQLARGVVVDLNGSTLQRGTLETKQALSFLPGVTYTLRYVLGNPKNQSNAVTVSIAGLVTETRTQGGVKAFTEYQTSFTPMGPVTAKLVFASSGGGNDDDGLLLDGVSIRPD